MQYIAESKNIKMSPRKVRLIADSVKKLALNQAVTNLSLMAKRAATPVKKTVESAIANAVNNFKANKDNLIIKDIQINEGITYKRYHYAARGRVRPYKKRTSHIKVILEEKNNEIKNMKKSEETKTPVKVEEEKKEVKTRGSKS